MGHQPNAGLHCVRRPGVIDSCPPSRAARPAVVDTARPGVLKPRFCLPFDAHSNFLCVRTNVADPQRSLLVAANLRHQPNTPPTRQHHRLKRRRIHLLLSMLKPSRAIRTNHTNRPPHPRRAQRPAIRLRPRTTTQPPATPLTPQHLRLTPTTPALTLVAHDATAKPTGRAGLIPRPTLAPSIRS